MFLYLLVRAVKLCGKRALRRWPEFIATISLSRTRGYASVLSRKQQKNLRLGWAVPLRREVVISTVRLVRCHRLCRHGKHHFGAAMNEGSLQVSHFVGRKSM